MFPRRVTILIAIAAAAFCCLTLLDLFQPFWYMRLRSLDRDVLSRCGRTATPDPRLVFLAIDSDSVGLDPDVDGRAMYGLTDSSTMEARAFALMSQRFPWPREIYALILERLVNAGAKVVAFDLTFPSPTEGDEVFRLALEKYRAQVVIGSNFVQPSWNGPERIGASQTRPPETLIPQTAPMDDRVAYTNFWPDPDEVVRRAQYRVTFEQVEGRGPTAESEQFLSLAARALTKAGLGHALPRDLESHALRFAGAPRVAFPPRSVFEIFVPDYWKKNFRAGEFFRGKIVVIGAEGNWQHDDHQTPFGSMPGSELHLNAINTALHGEFINEMSPSASIILTALTGFLGLVLSVFIRSPWRRLSAWLGVLAGGSGIALLAFNYMAVLVPLIAPCGQLSFTVLFGLVCDFAGEQIDKRRVRRIFERYVSRDVVKQMLDDPKLYAQSLGGIIKPVTVLFSDIRGYSLVSAQSDPHVLVNQLNEYLSAMVECVFRFGGTLDKFIGDAVMAVWGNARSDGPREDAINAIRAALAMRDELASLNKAWRARGLPEFAVGIAINHGEVVVGNIGSPHRMEFTVIGDAVNISWKLQELTKQLPESLIVGPRVRDLVVEHFEVRSLGEAMIPGFPDPVAIFSVGGPVEVRSEAEVPYPVAFRHELPSR
jgi:adenylate cyclase